MYPKSSERQKKKKKTYTMSSLTAPLQPNATALCNLVLTKLDRIIPVRLDHPQALLLTLNEPPVLGSLDSLSDQRRISLRQQRPRGLEHIHVRHALVAGSADDHVDIKRLLIHNGSIGGGLILAVEVAADLDLELIALLGNRDDLARSHDAVRPLRLVGAEHAALVVHDLIKMLNELEADDTVVGGLGVGEEVRAVGRGAGVDGVNEFGVEDGVDTVTVSCAV